MNVPPLIEWARWSFTTLTLVLLLGCKPGGGATAPAAGSPEEARPATDSKPLSSSTPAGGSSTDSGRAETSATESSTAPRVESNQLDVERASTGEAQRPTLFQGWPTPKLALFITGQQHGYIEPCGCTGLANQKGGLARRHSLALQLAEKGWPILPIDAGNQVRRFGRQAEIKFQMTVEGMRQIGYQGAGLGVDDLRLSVGELLATTVGDDSPFVSANAAVLDLTPKFRVASAAGMKIGIVSVIGTQMQQEINAVEITTSIPDEALEQILPQLEAANCDMNVLMAQASIEEAKRLGRKYEAFKIVVVAGGDDPTYQPETIETGAMFMQTGMKSKYVMVVGIFDDPQQPLRYQRIPLDDRFPDTGPMMDLLASYQDQLKTLGLDGLGLRPIPHPSGAQFVGSEKCGECHDSAYEKWLETPHHQATKSLVEPGERIDIARHHDPECLSCHVTGWHPQRYFRYASGYLGFKESPQLHGNGCENCHGPGSEHVAVHAGEVDVAEDVLEKANAAMRLPLTNAEQKCLECHDLDNDPDFQEPGAFDTYWEKIEHGLD